MGETLIERLRRLERELRIFDGTNERFSERAKLIETLCNALPTLLAVVETAKTYLSERDRKDLHEEDYWGAVFATRCLLREALAELEKEAK